MASTTATNPDIIQAPPPGSPATTPLFLIHDGGGTVVSYHSMSQIQRPVYGISNPNFDSGDPWEGGIPEMAAVYAGLIHKTVATKGFPVKRRYGQRLKILLGGWSLGGVLSLEIAHLLRTDDKLEVVGIVMVDSLYPEHPKSDKIVVTKMPEPGPRATTPQRRSHRCMGLASEMLGRYSPPAIWKEDLSRASSQDTAPAPSQDSLPLAPEDSPSTTAPTSPTFAPQEPSTSFDSTPATSRAASPIWGLDSLSSSIESIDAAVPPPIILLKAKNTMFPRAHALISAVDLYRDDPALGWGQHNSGLVKKVIELEGNHFDLFEKPRINGTSNSLRVACTMLEEGAV